MPITNRSVPRLNNATPNALDLPLAKHRKEQIIAELAAKEHFIRRRNQWLNLGSAFVGGDMASLLHTKKSVKFKFETASKIVGFSHRYFGLAGGYTARSYSMATNTTWRVANHLSAKAAMATQTGQALMHGAQVFAGIYAVTNTVNGLKNTYNAAYNLRADIKVNKDRKNFHTEAEGYNPETGKFNRNGREASDPQRVRRLQEMLMRRYDFRNTVAGDVTRNKKQLAGDYASLGCDIWNRYGVGLHSIFTLVPAAQLASHTVPIYTIFLAGSLAALSAYRSGMHIAAMNNAYHAAATTESPFLKSFSQKVVNQRADSVRIRLMYTLGYSSLAVSNAVTTAGIFASFGTAAPAALALNWLSAGSMAAANTFGTFYEMAHQARLDKWRSEASTDFEANHLWDEAPQQVKRGQSYADLLAARQTYFQNLSSGKKGIAYAEIIAVKALRSSILEEKQQCVRWLRDLGITENTIIKIQLAPTEGDALRNLRVNLYTNRLTHSFANNRYGHKTFGQIVGINSAIKKYRELRHKEPEIITPHRKLQALVVKSGH